MYHVTCTVLKPLDQLQERFLRNAGLSDLEALMVFNLAPLTTRRDVAMLGLIHRTVLKKGPEQFQQYFALQTQARRPNTRGQARREEHGRQLQDYRTSSHLNVVRRSALGLVAVYNLLPARIVHLATVKDFQVALQDLVKQRAQEGCEDWKHSLSPRIPLYRHPLK